jgi:7-cyano-7-deazaguanine synthase
MKRAVVLLSGGLDSATVLFYAKKKGFKVFCLVFDYGQRHAREINAAKRIARAAGSSLQAIKINLPWKGSSLLDTKLKVPVTQLGGYPVSRRIPSTYVPARNTIFLSFALSYAEAIGSRDIFIGANAVDFSGYPDCRSNYYEVFNKLSRLATKAGLDNKPIKIHTPLINKTKKEIVLLAKKLQVPLGLTWSCYRGGRRPCGVCDSCRLREKGFKQANVQDPSKS